MGRVPRNDAPFGLPPFGRSTAYSGVHARLLGDFDHRRTAGALIGFPRAGTMTFGFDADATAAVIVGAGQNSSVRITCHREYLRYFCAARLYRAGRTSPSPAGDSDHHSPAIRASWQFGGLGESRIATVENGSRTTLIMRAIGLHNERFATQTPRPVTRHQMKMEKVFLAPKDFRFRPVTVASPHSATGLLPLVEVVEDVAQPLGPLEKFTGAFTGNGFNLIFRPLSSPPPPTNTKPVSPGVPRDNVLQLNLTEELLSFGDADKLADVPNRGMVQDDIFFAGVAYLQFIQDITGLDPHNNKKPGIHYEPGLWMNVGETTTPTQGKTLMRMGSIPHGTSFLAQGTFSTRPGRPTFPKVSITPTFIETGEEFRFPSQDADNSATDRIPQDLSSLIAEGKITQELLDNPNSWLEKDIASQKISETTTTGPLFGGGARNMAFLLGDKDAKHPNAETGSMTATFWIETVEDNGITSTQIQYSQQVCLNFNGLKWPHVSVATLRPVHKA
jgi:hypothetical protein